MPDHRKLTVRETARLLVALPGIERRNRRSTWTVGWEQPDGIYQVPRDVPRLTRTAARKEAKARSRDGERWQALMRP